MLLNFDYVLGWLGEVCLCSALKMKNNAYETWRCPLVSRIYSQGFGSFLYEAGTYQLWSILAQLLADLWLISSSSIGVNRSALCHFLPLWLLYICSDSGLSTSIGFTFRSDQIWLLLQRSMVNRTLEYVIIEIGWILQCISDAMILAGIQYHGDP
jgi:hypothetical protein